MRATKSCPRKIPYFDGWRRHAADLRYLLGNTVDAFPIWLKGQEAEGSSALFGLLFYLATFWFMLSAKWLLHRRDKNTAATETGEKS